jgi:hypothetical protein
MTQEPASRASRIALGVVVSAAPAIVTCALLAALFDATLFDYFPLVSDEIAYQRQIAAFAEAGINGGYFNAFERPAPFAPSHFSVHGPAFPIVYGVIGSLVGWHLYSGPIFNLVVLAVAIAAFLVMGRLSRLQIVLAGAVILTSWWVLLMASITMQESLNQAVMIVIAGCAARLMLADTPHRGRLLIVALVVLAAASVLRPTNWIVAVPLVLLGMPRQQPLRVALATTVATLGIPVFWLLWRYLSAPIPDLQIEWTPATSRGALGMIASYFFDHIEDNMELFNVASFLETPFFQHVMFESIALLTACVLLAAIAWRRRRASAAASTTLNVDLFVALTLGLALVGFLGFYFDSDASISRVTAPFLLLSLLVLVASRAHHWIVLGAFAANLLVAPSFVAAYRAWRTDLFRHDLSRYDQFRAQLTPVLAFDPRRAPWCNTLLTTTYEREIVAVPAGVGLVVGRPAGNLVPPIKSGYVLLTPDSVADFGDKAQLQPIATTVLGELYANRDAACDRADTSTRTDIR